jgi:hypothetical protein
MEVLNRMHKARLRSGLGTNYFHFMRGVVRRNAFVTKRAPAVLEGTEPVRPAGQKNWRDSDETKTPNAVSKNTRGATRF